MTGLKDAQSAMAQAQEEAAAAIPIDPAQEASGDPGVYAEESTALYTDLPLDAEGYPVE